MTRFVLGISAHYHDSAAALIRDGEIVAAASEERFSRIKHDPSFPVHAARWCLESHGLSPDDLECVVFHEKPLWKFERLIVSQLREFPRSFKAFRQMAMAWLPDKLWVRSAIVQHIGVPARKIMFCNHHLSHAASAFYCSPFENAAVLTVDGVGEWATTALFDGRASGLERLAEIHFPHSIGLVYSAFTAYLGFQVNDGEPKVMGLAAYGEPRFQDKVRKVIRSRDDGSFEVDLSYVSYHYSASQSYSGKFEELFGPARPPAARMDLTSAEGRRYADIAASVQAVLEDCIVNLANALHERTGRSDLCIAGGVGLNAVANYHVLKRTPFRRLFVHPAAGDDGCAAGAALWAWNEVLGGTRHARPLPGAALGKKWSDGYLASLVDAVGASHEALDADRSLERAVDDLGRGRAVGWFHDRFEWGPRALGYRSILADPRRPGMNDLINQKIKFREEFRPFAPAVLAGAEQQYFDLPEGSELVAPWMLMVAPVRPQAQTLLPATTHVDATARAQVVSASANPRFHRLLELFGQATGHPVLLNTSFNLKGEPIVASPLQALRTFYSSDLDVLYLENYRLENTAIGRNYYA
jgi:carbamoyltransferase